MATCKDCIHYEVCGSLGMEVYRWGRKPTLQIFLDKYKAEHCTRFKTRSRFVELPCRVSGDCFFVNQNGTIQRATLERVYMFSTSIELFLNDGREIYSTSLNESNIELFPTYEEAEQALKEREGDA